MMDNDVWFCVLLLMPCHTDVQQPGCWKFVSLRHQLCWGSPETPGEGANAQWGPVPVRIRRFCALKSLKTGDDTWDSFHIMSHGVYDCKIIWYYIYIYIFPEECRLQEQRLIGIHGYWDSLGIPCFFHHMPVVHLPKKAIQNSNSYRFYVVCWFLGSQPQEVSTKHEIVFGLHRTWQYTVTKSY